MAQTIQIKRTTTANHQPTTLAIGELAVGLGDDPIKMWIGTSGGVRQLFAGEAVEDAEDDAVYGRCNGDWVKQPDVLDAAPANPPPNTLWFDAAEGILYLWYDDGDSEQWVAIAGGQGPVGPRGEKGIDGVNGVDGAQGPTGPIGGITYSAQAFTTAGNTSYTTPSDSTADTVYRIRMVAGGGGGGNYGSGTTSWGGGGGGAGQFKEFVITGIAPATNLPIVIGAAGAGTNTTGGNGGNTTVTIGGQAIVCNGGAGGEGSRGAGSTPANTAYGGAGGDGGTTPAIAGLTMLLDVPGSRGNFATQYGQVGNGGDSVFGPGARVSSTVAPSAAQSYGSGGASSWAVLANGGLGAAGAVFIERIQG